jgi:hypothetical protein
VRPSPGQSDDPTESPLDDIDDGRRRARDRGGPPPRPPTSTRTRRKGTRGCVGPAQASLRQPGGREFEAVEQTWHAVPDTMREREGEGKSRRPRSHLLCGGGGGKGMAATATATATTTTTSHGRHTPTRGVGISGPASAPVAAHASVLLHASPPRHRPPVAGLGPPCSCAGGAHLVQDVLASRSCIAGSPYARSEGSDHGQTRRSREARRRALRWGRTR